MGMTNSVCVWLTYFVALRWMYLKPFKRSFQAYQSFNAIEFCIKKITNLLHFNYDKSVTIIRLSVVISSQFIISNFFLNCSSDPYISSSYWKTILYCPIIILLRILLTFLCYYATLANCLTSPYCSHGFISIFDLLHDLNFQILSLCINFCINVCVFVLVISFVTVSSDDSPIFFQFLSVSLCSFSYFRYFI